MINGTVQEIYQQAKEASINLPNNKNGAGGVFFMLYKDEDNIIDNDHRFDHGLLFNVRDLFAKNANDEMMKQYQQEFNDILEDVIMNFNESNRIYLGRTMCSHCGQKVGITFNGKNFFLQEKCKANIESFSFDIPVPSGVLLCGNDFRDLFPDVDHDIRTIEGVVNTVGDYSKLGIFHSYVGNSSPFVEKNKKTDVVEIGVFDGGNEKNRIQTSLWWVSVMDEKLFKEHCKIKKLKIQDTIDEMVDFKIKVKPGMYRCTYFNEGGDPKMFATLEFISSEIPEDRLDMKKILNSFEKDTYPDCFEDYVNNKYPVIYSSFPTYIYLTVTGLVRRDDIEKNSWFHYTFDRDEFLKQVDVKYPNLLEKTVDQRFFELEGFGSRVQSFYPNSMGGEFEGKVNSFTEALAYNEHFSIWAVASIYFRDVLVHNKFEKDEHRDDIRRMFNLCIINLEERGLIEEALSYLQSIEGQYDTKPNVPEENANTKVVESFRSLYQRKYPEKDFDVVKNVLIASL